MDPSQKDIDLAREYQKIKAPNCFCGKPSRLKKVKKSNVNENSRAVGKYFFFCASRKTENPCRFARPVKEHRQRKREVPPKEESTEKDESQNAKADERNSKTSVKETLESAEDPGESAPDDDKTDNNDFGSKKKSGKTESPPQVSDGSKSSDSSSDTSSVDSGDD